MSQENRPENIYPYELVISPDTSRPSTIAFSKDFTVERKGFNDIEARITGEPFRNNSMFVERWVNSDGEVFKWNVEEYPQISSETRENLEEIVNNNAYNISDKKELVNALISRFPFVRLENESGLKIVNLKNPVTALGKETQGDTNDYVKDFLELPREHKVIPLDYNSQNLLDEIEDPKKYVVAAGLKISTEFAEDGIKQMHDLIQSGLFSEESIRSFVDIRLGLGKR